MLVTKSSFINSIYMRSISWLIFILAFFFYACKTTADKSVENDNLLAGSGKLLADQQTDSTGAISKQDTNVSGLLIYTTDGKMSVQIIWHGARNKIMSDSIMNGDGISFGTGIGLNTWTTEQARTIIDSYDAYFGDYSTDWQTHTVTHTVTASLRPEKKGTLYKRIFKLSGDTLFLKSTEPKMKWQIAWVRNI